MTADSTYIKKEMERCKSPYYFMTHYWKVNGKLFETHLTQKEFDDKFYEVEAKICGAHDLLGDVGLPSDEEIEKKSNDYGHGGMTSLAEGCWMPKGFIEGAKWMREKIEGKKEDQKEIKTFWCLCGVDFDSQDKLDQHQETCGIQMV